MRSRLSFRPWRKKLATTGASSMFPYWHNGQPLSSGLRHFRSLRSSQLPLLLAPFLILASGCGSEYEFVPISGIVTVDGKPLANVSVTFTPIGGGLDAGPGAS